MEIIAHNYKLNIEWPDYYQCSPLVFVLFLGYVLWWFLEGNFRFPALGAIRFEFLVGAVLGGFAITAYFSNPNRQYSGLGIWVSLLLIVMLIMVPLSYVPDISYTIFIDRIVKYALFGFFIVSFVTTPNRLKWFISAFLFTCLKMGQEGLVGIIKGSLVWENQGIPRLHGSTPRYAHPNSFSGMALGSLPFSAYFFPLVPKYLKIVLIIQIFFAAIIILYTGSRTGYVGLVFGLVLFIWRTKNRKQTIFYLLVISTIIGPFIPESYLERANSIITLKEKEGHSAEARKLIYQDALNIFFDNPFGIGVSAFRTFRVARFANRPSEDPHSLYLEIATNLGIQGIIIWIGLISVLINRLLKIISSIDTQIKNISQILITFSSENDSTSMKLLQEHLLDLRIMDSTCKAVLLYLIIRLALGFFGHDLYEIYWWFIIGSTIAVSNINIVALRRTRILYDAINGKPGA